MSNQRVFEEFFLSHKVKQGFESEADDGDIGPVLVFWENDSWPMIRKNLPPIGFDPIKYGENQSGNPPGDRIDERVPSHREIVWIVEFVKVVKTV